GRLALQRSAFDEAEAELRRAVTLGLEGGLLDVAAEGLLGLSSLHRERREGLEHATVLLDVARGLAARGVPSPVLELRIAAEQARVDRAQRRYEAARDGLQQALARAEAEGLEPDHSSVVTARNDLAANLMALGQIDEAGRIFDELLPRVVAAKGPEHRSVGTLLVNLGVVAHNQRRWDVAVEHYRRALELYEGHDARRADDVRFRLGVLRREQGQLDDAVALLERVLDDRTARLGPEHADLAEVLEALADVERLQGRVDPALAHARRAVALLEQAHGPDYLDLRAPLVTLGKLELTRQHPEEATQILRRAHALVTASEVDGVVRAEVFFELARATLHDPDARTQALSLARDAATLLHEAGERAEPMRREVDAWLREHGG
ncbi:MAG: tetratricopeptide repeat protein, partial [Myxococcales bacterium]|nr:tetratricopeptide repeat protein [Myxococcales bacterium]